MAQVTNPRSIAESIDDYLAYLWAEWESIPALAAEWDDWDAYEQLDFVMEWPIREDRLLMLRDWAAAGCMTDEQQARYNQLLDLIAAHRDTLERLIAD